MKLSFSHPFFSPRGVYEWRKGWALAIGSEKITEGFVRAGIQIGQLFLGLEFHFTSNDQERENALRERTTNR